MKPNFESFLKNFFFFVNNKEGIGKIVVGSGLPGIHYTLYLKGKSGYIDIHRTNEKLNRRKTLFSIKEIDAKKIIDQFMLRFPYLMLSNFFSRQIGIKELLKNEWYIFPSDENSIDVESVVKVRSKRFKFNKEITKIDFSKSFFSIKKIKKFESKIFTLFDKNYKTIGSLINVSQDPKNLVYFHIKKTSISKFYRECFFQLIQIVNENEIENKQKLKRLLNKLLRDQKFI